MEIGALYRNLNPISTYVTKNLLRKRLNIVQKYYKYYLTNVRLCDETDYLSYYIRVNNILCLFTKTYFINNLDKILNAYLQILYNSRDKMVV